MHDDQQVNPDQLMYLSRSITLHCQGLSFSEGDRTSMIQHTVNCNPQALGIFFTLALCFISPAKAPWPLLFSDNSTTLIGSHFVLLLLNPLRKLTSFHITLKHCEYQFSSCTGRVQGFSIKYICAKSCITNKHPH